MSLSYITHSTHFPLYLIITKANRTLYDLFPATSPTRSHVTLPLVPQGRRACSCLRTFIHAVPAAWKAVFFYSLYICFFFILQASA